MLILLNEKISRARRQLELAFRPIGVRVYFIVNMLLLVAIWVLCYLLYANIGSGLAVLHYNIDIGINLIGEPVKILNTALFYSIIIFLNISLFIAFARRIEFRFIYHLLFTANILISLFFLMAIASIYLINYI